MIKRKILKLNQISDQLQNQGRLEESLSFEVEAFNYARKKYSTMKSSIPQNQIARLITIEVLYAGNLVSNSYTATELKSKQDIKGALIHFNKACELCDLLKFDTILRPISMISVSSMLLRQNSFNDSLRLASAVSYFCKKNNNEIAMNFSSLIMCCGLILSGKYNACLGKLYIHITK